MRWRGSAYTGSQDLLSQVASTLPALQARAAWLAGRAELRLQESCVVPVPSESTPLQMMAEGVADHEAAEAVAGVRLALATLAAGNAFDMTEAIGPGGLIVSWRLPEALVPFLLWVESAPTNCPTALTLTIGGVWPLVGVSQNGAIVSMGVQDSTANAVAGADQVLAKLWLPEPAAPTPDAWQVTGSRSSTVQQWQAALAAGKSVDVLTGREAAKGFGRS